MLNNFRSFVYAVDSTNPNSDYRDVGPDSAVGGRYSFFDNGKLKEYDFLGKGNVTNYKELYDSTGRLIRQEGGPIIHKTAQMDADSISIQYYLLTMNRQYKSVTFKLRGNRDSTLNLYSDSLFSNVLVARYVARGLSGTQDVKGVLRVEYDDQCTKVKHIFLDSLYLQYSRIIKPE